MPKRQDIKSICVLGSGPVVIGQAAEFDYSGTQAIKALKEDGYRVILINSNPATIMTDPETADATYIEPLEVQTVAAILRKERPDALLPTVGGQTALNLGVALAKQGVLQELGIEMIGAELDVIERAENRQLFKDTMTQIGLSTLRSVVCHSLQEARHAKQELGYPVIIRPSFTLGGSGGGIAYNDEQLENIVQNGLQLSPTNEVLLEESALGWKEYEFEVMRDKNDNAVIVCSIENIDPMGVHTGDSITVAPAQTLTDKEYQVLRDASLQILRAIGVKTGGSNVQFAIHPQTGRVVVVEMNPRVSRSSALASKATGYPIAKIAAKVAVGYTLDEISNDITLQTKAAFEPSLDYVVIKWPRFAFEKFKGVNPVLTTQMQSVGEAMSIGRTFKEALGKVLCSLEYGTSGFEFDASSVIRGGEVELFDENKLKIPGPDTLWLVAEAFRAGLKQEHIHKITQIDPWFLTHIRQVIEFEGTIFQMSWENIDEKTWWQAKQWGFSDARLAKLLRVDEKEVRIKRKLLGVNPVYKRVDTCAAEFEAHTPYLYSTYERPFSLAGSSFNLNHVEEEARPLDKKKIVVLGSGPIRIGQGIEFDYCCVHAVKAFQKLGFETIMVNCNPETVSTDYDCSDRLYFEPLTFEHVLNIVELEKPVGIVIQFGGQTPLKLAKKLEAAGVKILGTSPEAIDRAEDRKRSSELVSNLGLLQPPSITVTSIEEAEEAANTLGYPVLLRPSYVLGGRGMELVYDIENLRRYFSAAIQVSNEKPVLVDRFLTEAIEVDVDVICDGKDVLIGGVMQHVEQAGIHSGDSTCVLPTHSLSQSVVEDIVDASKKLALELKVVGLMNVQFAVQHDTAWVLEVNPRASRTVPFVSKAVGLPLAQVAAKVMAGITLREQYLKQPPIFEHEFSYVSVKAPVFPFTKFKDADTLLGPEMRSTGEVMGIDETFEGAFAKSQLGALIRLPTSGRVFVSVADKDKHAIVPAVKRLSQLGFEIVSTQGTKRFLAAYGIHTTAINKVREGSPHAIDWMQEGKIDLMFNTTQGPRSVQDGYRFRRKALELGVPYYTTVAAAKAASLAIAKLQKGAEQKVRSMQEYTGVR